MRVQNHRLLWKINSLLCKLRLGERPSSYPPPSLPLQTFGITFSLCKLLPI